MPYLSARDVAEFALGMTLSLARKICLADSRLRHNQWQKSELIGMSLRHKTFGIVGYGEIGKETATLAQCFGMKVQVYVRNLVNKQLDESVKPVTFSELLKTSDIISIHVPLTAETKGLFSEKEFELMKDTALLINTSRGGVINEKELYKALRDRTIGGAAIDVYEKERQYNTLFELNNIVVTPHIGAMTQEAQEQIGLQIVKKIVKFFDLPVNSSDTVADKIPCIA